MAIAVMSLTSPAPKDAPNINQTRIMVFSLFAFAVLVSAFYANLKRFGLAYDNVDYSLYAQFSARFFDPGLSRSFTAEPDGYNFLNYHGTEGIYSINQSLHFELIKYVYALVFWFWNTPLAVYILVALLYFSPLLYILAIHKIESARDNQFVQLFALTYVAFPAVLATTTYDLRPRIFLAPFFVISVLSVIYERSMLEKIFLLGLLFLAREEAIIFGALIVGMNLFSSGDRRKIVLETGLLALLWTGYVVLVVLFLKWTGYPLDAPHAATDFLAYLPYLIFPAGILIILAMCGIILHRSGKLKLRQVFQLLVFASITIPLGVQLRTEMAKWVLTDRSLIVVSAERFLFSEKMILYFIVLFLLAVMVWHLVGQFQGSKVFHQVWMLIICVFIIAGTIKNVGVFRNVFAQQKNAQIVFNVVRNTNSYKTRVLTDENTYQAFYNYEYVTDYARLPWSLAREKRFFPDNLPFLTSLLPQMEYIVISRASDQDIQALLQTSQIRFTTDSENDQYKVLKIVH